MNKLKAESRKFNVQIICSISLVVYLIIFSFRTNATVVLNEVAIQPNQTVELYNSASTSADISSWFIDDAGGSTYFTVPNQTILAPKSCLIFNSDFNFNKSSADVIRLFDNSAPPTTSSAKPVEQYAYTKAPELSYSFSKKIDGGIDWQIATSSVGLSNETLVSCIPTLTPTAYPTDIPIPTSLFTPSPSVTPVPSSIPVTPTPLPNYENIYISEVFAYPSTGENEWIELYNDNNSEVYLSYWYVDDGENTGSSPKSFSLTMQPYSYHVIDLSSSIFNNSGDIVRLLNNEKNEKDSLEYGVITQGNSLGRIDFSDDSYCEQDPSKGLINNSCLANITQSKTIQSGEKKIPSSNQSQPSVKSTTSPMTKMKTSSIVSQKLPTRQKGQVLGAHVTTQHTNSLSPTPYLSFVSFSYSLLTIVSIFIKMKYG